MLSLLSVPLADGADVAPYERALVRRINEVRENPLETVHRHGIDVRQASVRLGVSVEELEEGFPPLVLDERLNRSARLHNLDMLDRGYYSRASPSGVGYRQRMLAAGYLTVRSGESLGMLAFGNFLEPMDAAEALIDNMIRDELDLLREGSTRINILDPNMADIGVSMISGLFQMPRAAAATNVYLVSCDFGNESTSDIESGILETMNRLRRGEEITFKFPSVSSDNVVQEESVVLQADADRDIDLLRWDPRLAETARRHLASMKEGGFFGHGSPSGDPVGPFGRVLESGYEIIRGGELIAALSFTNYVSPKEAADYLIGKMLVLMDEEGGKNPFLDAGLTDFGASFDVWTFTGEDGKRNGLYLMVVNIACRESVFGGGYGKMALHELVVIYPEAP